MPPVIYEPKGPAKEYSHLAINLYHGCCFACRYCYAPGIAFKKLDEWSANPYPKKNILERIEKDAKRMRGDPRSILLCFTSDPYQSPEAAKLTRDTLLILEKYEMTATVLTKAGTVAMQDFDILERNGWKFGTTLSYVSNRVHCEWEQGAADPLSRVNAIQEAYYGDIKTWVSLEPVMDAGEALRLIQHQHKYVDFWKVGKMNHRKLNIDWPKFREDAIALLDNLGAKYYIKKELRDAK